MAVTIESVQAEQAYYKDVIYRIITAFPKARVRLASEIDPEWDGLAIEIDWLLVVIQYTPYIRMIMMGVEDPYDYDIYNFHNMDGAMQLLKDRVSWLGITKH